MRNQPLYPVGGGSPMAPTEAGRVATSEVNWLRQRLGSAPNLHPTPSLPWLSAHQDCVRSTLLRPSTGRFVCPDSVALSHRRLPFLPHLRRQLHGAQSPEDRPLHSSLFSLLGPSCHTLPSFMHSRKWRWASRLIGPDGIGYAIHRDSFSSHCFRSIRGQDCARFSVPSHCVGVHLYPGHPLSLAAPVLLEKAWHPCPSLRAERHRLPKQSGGVLVGDSEVHELNLFAVAI